MELGLLGDGLEQPAEVRCHPVNPVRVEEVRVVLDAAGERALTRLHEEGEVELRRRARRRLGSWSSPPLWPWRTNITWNSGLCASPRGSSSAATSFSKGTS